MAYRFDGKVVVVTGSANGIGRATALRFAAAGAMVAAIDLPTEQTANQSMLAEAVLAGGEVVAYNCDVADAAALQQCFHEIIQQFQHIDVLVTSAGIYSGKPLTDVPLPMWQQVLDTNLTGVFLCNQAVAATMQQQRSGAIINIASMAGKTGFPATAQYAASKSGVIGLTRSVAMELAPFGVTVNTLCPGNTQTRMLQQVAQTVGTSMGMSADAWIEQRRTDCPLQRIAEPWEIAGVVLFLASEDARYITAQAIEVDGGMVHS